MVTYLALIVLFIVLSAFLRFRYVAIIFIVGNILFFIYFTSLGQAGGWLFLIYQLPAILPASIGVWIGTSISDIVRPIIRKKQDSVSNLSLDGTSKACENKKVEESSIKQEDTKNQK
jgi:hypothetical protein